MTSTPHDHHGDHMDEWRYAMMGLYVNRGLDRNSKHLRTRTQRLRKTPTRVAA